MQLPSKEIISEVMGYPKRVECQIPYDINVTDEPYMMDSMPDKVLWQTDNVGIGVAYCNIHELAHKCKEWAKGKGFQILSGVDNANTYRADVYYTDFLVTDFEAIENTEPEAIFKCAKWIQKEINVQQN